VKKRGLFQKQQAIHFIHRLQSGMNSLPFEATAQLYFDLTSSMKAGQILFEAVLIENSVKEKLFDCRMNTIVLPLDVGKSDLAVWNSEGIAGIHRPHPDCIANEAFQPVEDIIDCLLLLWRVSCSGYTRRQGG